MRLHIDEPEELAGCFIEIDERGWSQAVLKKAYEDDANWREIWGQKVTACRLVLPDGSEVVDPAVVPDRLDDLDIRLYNFTLRAMRTACDYLATLGEVKRRTSFGAGGSATKTTMTTAPNSTTTRIADGAA